MKKITDLKKLRLSQQTIRTLQTGELKQAVGGTAGGCTVIATWTCSAAGCGGSNNSCGTCYEN